MLFKLCDFISIPLYKVIPSNFQSFPPFTRLFNRPKHIHSFAMFYSVLIRDMYTRVGNRQLESSCIRALYPVNTRVSLQLFWSIVYTWVFPGPFTHFVGTWEDFACCLTLPLIFSKFTQRKIVRIAVASELQFGLKQDHSYSY